GQRGNRRLGSLEAKHRSHPSLDAPVILFDPGVEISALADADRLQRSLRSILQPVLAIAGYDCLAVCLAAINDNALRSAVALQRLAQEAFSRRQITMLAEPEFDRVADTVDGAIEIHPAAANFDVGFVHIP